MTTGILALVCIILIFILYIVSGGWKKYGGFLGIVKWLKSGAVQSGGRPAPSGGKLSSASPKEEHDTVVKVLQEIYAEFDTRYQVLQDRLGAVEKDNQLLRTQLNEVLAKDGTVAATVSTDSIDGPLSSRASSELVAEAHDELITRAIRLIQQTEVASTAGAGESVKDPLASSTQTKYFEILDLLEAGMEISNITNRLDVSEADVTRVADLMLVPAKIDGKRQSKK